MNNRTSRYRLGVTRSQLAVRSLWPFTAMQHSTMSLPRSSPSPQSSSMSMSSSSIAVPFVYHTCPTFRQGDLDQERANLSEAIRNEIDHDIAGTAALPREPPDFVKERLAQFDDELDRIPADEKHSYLLAVERRSIEFVHNEMSPLAFLRAEGFDPAAAARRLVNYWEIRHKMFGDDRAFRSMMVVPADKNKKERNDNVVGEQGDGDGCMTELDWEAVRMGGAQELPPDSFGRAVIFFKRNCVPKDVAVSQPVTLRALFYVLHRAALDESAQRHGFVYLYDAKTVQLTPMLRKRLKLCLHLVEQCAPIKLRACHSMYPPCRSLAQLVRPVVLGIMTTNFRQRTVQHLGTTHDYVVQLHKYGIHKDKIPVEIGGTMSLEVD